MMYKIYRIVLFSTLAFSLSAKADSLIEVYHQALLNDPVYAQAESTWHSEQMNLPIARAGYLTQLGFTAQGSRNYQATKPVTSQFTNNGYTWQYGYSLSLTQPIFDLVAWNDIKSASATVKAATATYLAAEQSLMQRTAQAYFNVMQASDQLRYIVANKKAVYEQLVTSEQKFKVGLIAITDVYDARSQYDQVVAQEIAAQNNLNIQLENLRAITGQHYQKLNGLGEKLPLLKPQPANIDQWVTVANAQNYQLKAQNYAVMAAMDNVKKIAAGNYPTLDLTSNYSKDYTDEGAVNSINSASSISNEQADLGLSLSYNVIQGGLVIAQAKQARYDYVTASGKLEEVHRNVVNQTRSSFFSVLSGISQIKADRQRIISARNALSATEAGFKVGTRTMVDVLNDLSTLYQAQQQYADDQYTYLSSLIDLKVAAGTLNVSDLAQISGWLSRAVVLPEQTKITTPSRQLDKKTVAKKPIQSTKRVVSQPAVVKKKVAIVLPGPEAS